MAKGELGKIFENWQKAEDTMLVTIETGLKSMTNLPIEDLSESDIDAIAKSRAKRRAEIIVENLQQRGYTLVKEGDD